MFYRKDLIINDDGIYLMESGELTSVGAVYSDGDGLFVLTSRNVMPHAVYIQPKPRPSKAVYLNTLLVRNDFR